MKLNETTGLYDNYGVWHIPFWQTQSFLLAVKISTCVLLCAIFLLVFLRYKKRKKLSDTAQLLVDLYALKSNHILRAERGQEFYMSLSQIIKRYFFYCFGYDVLAHTDTELIDYLQAASVDAKVIEEIQSIVRGSEIIKFANAQAIQERILEDYKKVVSLIQKAVLQDNPPRS